MSARRQGGNGRQGSEPMSVDPRAELSPDDAMGMLDAQRSAVAAFLERERPPANLVGFGVGVRWTDGQPTGERAVIAFVQHKVPEEALAEADRLPRTHEGVAVDVMAVGQLYAGVDVAPAAPVTAPTPVPDGSMVSTAPTPMGGSTLAHALNARMRPVPGGFSVGHFAITAGTIGVAAYDILPGGSVNPPRPGVGQPTDHYILSNNHVLANSNAGSPGDAVLQPGVADGGQFPGDEIAILARFVPIQFFPPVPPFLHHNLVACAVARGNPKDLDRRIWWEGQVRGWRRRTNVRVGNLVQKTGRTTAWNTGRIIAVLATVDVNYGGGRVARFRDQILTTPIAMPGDSGSLVLTWDNVAVGLLFAGSPLVTVCNQIENVRSLLRVEVAQLIL